MKISLEQVRRLRMRAQRLVPRPSEGVDTPEAVLEAVAGLQAQDLPSARLGLRARSRGLQEAGIVQALQTPGRLALTWTLRGTLHLHSAVDAAWLVPLLGPTFLAGDARRLRALGWDEPAATRGLALLRRDLEGRGPLTRPEIIRLLAEAGLPSAGQAPIHLIGRAALEGWLCAGPLREGEGTYTLFEGWAGPLERLPRAEALARLARRYLSAYAPAAVEDFAGWAGLKSADIRLGWEQITPERVACETGGKPLWLLKSQSPWLEDEPVAGDPVVRLLPRFDALLLGYASRDWLLDPAFARQVHPGGGMLRAAVLVDGQLRATWTMRTPKAGLQVLVEPFEPLPESLLPPLEAEAADLGRFLGLAVASEPVID